MKILVLNTEEIPWCPKCYEEMNGCPLETLKNEKPMSESAGTDGCRTLNSQQNTRLSEKIRERERLKYYANRESENKSRNERAKKNRERERENARKSYQRNKQTRIKRVSEYKDRVNPARVLTRTLHEFKQGIISFSEFLDKFRDGALSNNEGSKK